MLLYCRASIIANVMVHIPKIARIAEKMAQVDLKNLRRCWKLFGPLCCNVFDGASLETTKLARDSWDMDYTQTVLYNMFLRFLAPAIAIEANRCTFLDPPMYLY